MVDLERRRHDADVVEKRTRTLLSNRRQPDHGGNVHGRIRYREEIADHLENAPEAFIGMLDGHNFGKTIVRVAA
jgi:hypothetical protein